MTKINIKERAEIFKQLKTLFEFDKDGILCPIVSGMAGPLAFPLGYLDMSKIEINNQLCVGHLILTWVNEEKAQIVTHSNNLRDATNEEMLCAFIYYKKAIEDYRNEKIEEYSKNGKTISKYLQSRLGMIPYFYVD